MPCTIVVPCYNEAARLDLAAFLAYSVCHGDDFLFVDDGSTDGTGLLLDEFCALHAESLRVLHLAKNRGKAEAVRLGMLRALASGSDYVGYWDADLATPLSAIGQFRTYLDEHPQVEALLGARVRLLGRTIDRRPLRHCLGRLFATAAAWVLDLPVYDTQCGAKLFRPTERIKNAFAEPFATNWIFDVELLARLLASLPPDAALAANDLIHELPLDEWRDVAGSKVKATDFLRAAGQLVQIYRRYPPQAGRAGGAAIETLAAACETSDFEMPRRELRSNSAVAAPELAACEESR
jgi:dolichyl-phosphate beta-glucosyltransferase